MVELSNVLNGRNLFAYRVGRLVLIVSLILIVALNLYLSIESPALAFSVPILAIGFAVLLVVLQNPLTHLVSVLALFIVVARFEDGFQLVEAVYGLYFLSFLAIWLLRQLGGNERALLSNAPGNLLILFYFWVAVSLSFTFLFQGSFRGAVSEGLALLFIALYFPVAESCSKSERSLKAILGVIVGIGVVVVLRNLFTYAQAFTSAVYVYEIARGRVITNEVLILASSITVLCTYAVVTMSRFYQLIVWSTFTLLFGGLLLTQSRSYWLAFAFASFVMFLLMNWQSKKRLVGATLSSVFALGAIGFIVVPEYVSLILAGLIERFVSIGSAASSDISMINRFIEANAVLQRIAVNPIVGHGMGSSYRFYDITFELTRIKTFVHNGYLALWFKFGIVGLGLVLAFLLAVLRRGFFVAKSAYSSPVITVGALSSCAILASLLLTSLATNPFYLSDTTFVIGVATGVATGCHSLALKTNVSVPQ